MDQVKIVAPVLGIGFIFAVTQWVANQRGDKDDREKLRKQRQEERKAREKEARDMSLIRSAYDMADQGKGADAIEAVMRRFDVKITREEASDSIVVA